VHELAVTQSLLDTVLNEAKAAKANKVTRINLVVGELSGVASECVQFYFDILKKDTAAREAAIDFKQVPAQLRCRDCRTDFNPKDALWVCPGCGSYSIEVIKGRDCYIESIEVEP
jgi:hydrogenase nickel incorporation protein HypA/HybF